MLFEMVSHQRHLTISNNIKQPLGIKRNLPIQYPLGFIQKNSASDPFPYSFGYYSNQNLRVMKLFTRCLVLALIAFSWSCQPEISKEDEAQKHIPNDASFVLTYEPKQLMDKAGYDKAMQWPSVQDIIDDVAKENTYFSKILENPAASGVDLEKRFYFVMDATLLADEGQAEYAYWLFSIADPDAFQELWENLPPPGKPTSGDHTYFSENENTFLSWTDEWGIAGIGKEDDMNQHLQEIVELDPAQSLAKNANFQKCLKKEADVAIWMGSNGLAETIAKKGMNIFANLTEEDLKDNYLHHFMHFDAGEIRAQSDFFIKKKIRTDLDLFFKDRVKTDFTEVLPNAGNLEVMMTAAMNPRGINQILIEKYAKRAIQEAMKQQGLSFDDMLAALDGDIALASYKNEKGFGQTGLFIAKIGEQEKLNSLLETAWAQEVITKKEDGWYALNFEQSVEDSTQNKRTFSLKGDLLVKDDLIYMGESEELLRKIHEEDYLSPTGFEELKVLQKENIFALFTPFTDAALRDKIEVKNISAHANRKTAEISIKLKNQKENSLRQLMEVVKKEMEKKSEKEGKKI